MSFENESSLPPRASRPLSSRKRSASTHHFAPDQAWVRELFPRHALERSVLPGAGRGERSPGGRPGNSGGSHPSFTAFIKELGLDGNAAKEAQRIGTLPEKEKAKGRRELNEPRPPLFLRV
jgi:hypothetical protein